jgi:AraC family transcriptional regulator
VLKYSRQVGTVGLTESTYGRGTTLEAHTHEQHHFLLVLRGNYKEIVGGKHFDRRPGQLLFLPRDVAHEERHLTMGRHFMIDPSPESFDRLELPPADLPRGPELMPPEGVRLAMRIHREFWEPDAVSTLAVEAFAIELLVLLRRKSTRAREERPPRFLREVVELLSRRFSEPLTVAKVAREVRMNPTYLARVFRRWHGAPMGKFLIERRLDFACHQLLHTNDRMADVAAAAGFFDQSHFGKAFRQAFGISPGEFRRRSAGPIVHISRR